MTLLTIDCAAALCAACVYEESTGEVHGREVRDLGKGHAEHLMDVIATALAASGKAYSDLNAVAVSIGPGSFTGVRVGVSTARGLALALKIPAIGVTTLEAIAAEAFAACATTVAPGILAVIDAGRDGIYAGVYDKLGGVLYDPSILTLEETARLASDAGFALAGSASGRVAALMGEAEMTGFEGATADIAVYARLAAAKAPPHEKPKPLYLRAPDAKPQAGFVLPRRAP